MPRQRRKQKLVAIVPPNLADLVRAKALQEGRSVSNYLNRLLATQFPPEQLDLPLDGS